MWKIWELIAGTTQQEPIVLDHLPVQLVGEEADAMRERNAQRVTECKERMGDKYLLAATIKHRREQGAKND